MFSKELCAVTNFNLMIPSSQLLGTQPVDEDVDIIGNAPPVSSYPPMEIAKESTLKSEKCSSSSDSSTDSSSSSSG